MANKKFDYRVTQDGETWSAAIVRRVTARKTGVSKRQGGFATEAEAQQWGETELKKFVENLRERNKNRKANSEKRG